MMMKQILFAISLVLIVSEGLKGQDSDLKLIEKTLNYYLIGGTNNDFEMLQKAFHPTATMKFIGDGYQEVNAIEFFRNGMKPGPKQDRQTRIAAINVSGNAASARLEIEYPTFTFIDFMNMLKIDGEWKIVSKIFYRASEYEGN